MFSPMRHLYLFCLLFSLFTAPCLLTEARAAEQDTLTFRIVSYNVENLFDCRHDSLKEDYEFLPTSPRRWTYSKYRRKLDDLARTIIATGGWTPPALVALCEVENDTVLRDLTRRSLLREAGYRYLMTHSPDERGIDVALLYQPHLFKPIHWQGIRISTSTANYRPTRDLLHVCGLLLNLDTLDVFIAHLPSRSSGQKQSEPYRLIAAQRLKQAIDSICLRRIRPQIILMGDFNDTPANRSVRQILQVHVPPAVPHDPQPDALYHLLARRVGQKQKPWQHTARGSYKYHGRWELLDHIIVSGHLLLPTSPLYTSEDMAGIAALPFLLEEDPKYGGHRPFRTYQGPKYLGGYSDHLPVYADFRLLY